MTWRAALRATPDLKLSRIDPSATPLWTGTKDEAQDETKQIVGELSELQVRLHASASHGVLVVLQGRDTCGKDGVVRAVLGEMNPFGFRMHAFKAPSPIEAGHDFLWRLHQHTPVRGEIVVFNRSHYEDVLIRRVRKFDPEVAWRRRYAMIRGFEETLALDAGTVIVKLMPHISKAEQAERLKARLDDPEKRWKFNPGDLDDRKLWPGYDRAYEDATKETDADHAPWYVVPADRKWYRDLAVAHIMLETLTDLKLRYPKPDFDPAAIEIR